ncbi:MULTISPECIES: PAAR domain-containing protein [Paraburkholderia]|uniref:PAAR domain-containing protein n=1 Tax=Paraburkholderia TaxID=1822464 RepID=UPI00161EADBF|nr:MULTISPECIES: PAAR domain-containing protein [Paraburkholderia]
MTKALVCNGDPTTTGGHVVATASSMYDGDRRIALDQEMATCGKCPGEHPIRGSGTDMQENGRACVLDGDLVLCPCETNHVSASGDAGCGTV